MLKTQRRKLILVFILFSFILTSAAFGAGNARKGKYLFRKHCRACHNDKATSEEAGKPLSPISKTQAQWDVVFKTYTELPCADKWEKLKAKGLPKADRFIKPPFRQAWIS